MAVPTGIKNWVRVQGERKKTGWNVICLSLGGKPF